MVSFSTIRVKPDTCDCQLLYQCDVDLPLEQRTFTVLAFEIRCNAHSNSNLPTMNNQQVWDDVIIPEFRKKNDSIQTLLDNAPNSVYDLDGGTRIFKKNIMVSWSWSGTAPNRLLTITIYGISLTGNQLNAINAKLDERYGISNVVIVNG